MTLSRNMVQVLNFAVAKHHGQKYGDKEYFHHLDNVYQTYCYLFGEPDEQTFMLVYCHDILEDTDATVQELLEMGLSEDSISSLLKLTKKKGVPNHKYLSDLVYDRDALLVKIADSTSNLNYSLRDGNDRLIVKYTNNLRYLYQFV